MQKITKGEKAKMLSNQSLQKLIRKKEQLRKVSFSLGMDSTG